MKTIKKKLNGMTAGTLALLFAGAVLPSCTDLDEKMYSRLDQVASGAINPGELLTSAYQGLNNIHYTTSVQSRWGLNEIATDAALAPTRGGDWDDNGMYRAIDLHIWSSDDFYIARAFEQIHTAQFQAANVLRAAGATPQQKAEARFIQALCMYDVLNLWGFVVHREDMGDFDKAPAVMETQQAIEFIQKELEGIIDDLPEFDKTKAYVASKHAARFLLMKLHLNKGTFLNRANPGFPKADMDRVLELAKAIKDEPRGLELSVGDRAYFDNFAPNNDQISKENIFTLYNQSGDRGGPINHVRFATTHYNMQPSSWNGYTTLGKFYDLYESTDVRLGMAYNGYPGEENMTNPANAVNVGFLIGQQYHMETGAALTAGRGADGPPLSFTKEVTIRTSGATLETAGIRVAKYAFDFANISGQGNNDWVVFRYADVLLMEAEAILRGGTPGTATALDLVNEIRTARSASIFTSLDIDDLLDERGRELYWEGWRREDLIRFGKFLEPDEIRTATSPPHRLLYAVPSQQMAVNPNLKQNPGYE